MARVYIEMTIPSYYFETRQTARVVAWREATRLWWDRLRGGYELVTSEFTLAELGQAPAAKAEAGMELIKSVRVLPDDPEIRRIAAFYMAEQLMPRGAVGDAAHLAVASVHGIEFLLTWNCKHLANANKIPHLRALNARLGLAVPTLTTPFTLIPEVES